MKTKIKFSDIAGMLERDEMKEIIGSCGTSNACGSPYNPTLVPSLTPAGPVFGTPGKISAPLPGYSTPTYQGGELNTVVIPPRNNSYQGGELNSVVVSSGNSNSSSNSSGFFQIGGGYNSSNNIGYSNGYGAGTGGSTWSSISIDDQQRKPLTDCVFQSMAYLANLYGDSTLSFDSMKKNYDSLYNGAIEAKIIKPASEGGVDAYLMSGFTDQYFNRVGDIKTRSQLSNFIAAGGDNFAIATYDTGIRTSHAFVITGVTDTHFTGWDEQNQRPISIDKNLITGFVAINGVCH